MIQPNPNPNPNPGGALDPAPLRAHGGEDLVVRRLVGVRVRARVGVGVRVRVGVGVRVRVEGPAGLPG